MQQGTDRRKETFDDFWLEQQRAAIEADRQRTREALDLFRRATEALPNLDEMLREHEAGTKKLQVRLESEGARILASLGEVGAEHRRALAEECRSLTDDARRSMEEPRLGLEATFHSLLQRLDAAETAVAQDRMAMNQLNQRLIKQTELVERLTRRLEDMEKEQRDGLATIRGTTSQLHGHVSRLTRCISWFAQSSWWRRLFERPPVD